MPGEKVHTKAIVLGKAPAGERFLRLTLFSPEQGRIFCLKRISARASMGEADLFDHVEVVLEVAKNRHTYFMEHYRLIHRFSQLGSHYPSLCYASDFIRILDKNLVHAETFSGIFNATLQALQAWETTVRPDAVFLKSLYIFAREEGYPVKEHWFFNMEAEQKQEALSVINTPLGEQSIPSDRVDSLIANFKRWLTGYSDIIL